MSKLETIEEFYKRKHNWIPENIRNEIGHFNLFKIEPVANGKVRSVPYIRRDYFKITLAIGSGEIHFADKLFKVQKQALVFSNPFIPYKWEHHEKMTGFFIWFCLFSLQIFNWYLFNIQETVICITAFEMAGYCFHS